MANENEKKIVESNVESAIVGKTVVGEVHSCSRCKWLYWKRRRKGLIADWVT